MLIRRSGKDIPSNKEAKLQIQESTGIFGANKVTSFGGANVSFKNLRGNKARKVGRVLP